MDVSGGMGLMVENPITKVDVSGELRAKLSNSAVLPTLREG